MTTIDIQRAADRFTTDIGWLDSKHSFNFGDHWSPRHQGHGLLLVNNDDIVHGGGGFGTHGHRDMEIVTWVLSGELEHRDSTGTEGVIYPGLAQRMSAGSGIRHSEMNHSATEPVHFVQMWVVPDTNGVEPGYEQRDLSEALAAGGLVAVASGQGHAGAVKIHQRDAVLWAARVSAGDSVTIPDGAHVHAFVAVGSGVVDGVGDLAAGDALRLAGDGAFPFTAGAEGAELLVWVTA